MTYVNRLMGVWGFEKYFPMNIRNVDDGSGWEVSFQ